MWFEDLLKPERDGPVLHVYLFGQLGYEDGLRLQRHLVQQAAERPGTATLVVCEHPPCISVGRQGSHRHILLDHEELAERRWPIRWVNRGGGCFLHMPGQLAVYPILPLKQLGIGLQDYLDRLQRVLIAVLDDFSVKAATRSGKAGVWVGQRPIAGVGVAVRNWITWHGAVLNIAPDLLPFRHVRTGEGEQPMTSLARERHGAPRMAFVRQQLIEHFQTVFRLPPPSILFSHPLVRAERVAAATVP